MRIMRILICELTRGTAASEAHRSRRHLSDSLADQSEMKPVIQAGWPADRRPERCERLPSDVSLTVYKRSRRQTAMTPLPLPRPRRHSAGRPGVPFAPRGLPNHRRQREVIVRWPLPVHRRLSPANAAAAAAIITVGRGAATSGTIACT